MYMLYCEVIQYWIKGKKIAKINPIFVVPYEKIPNPYLLSNKEEALLTFPFSSISFSPLIIFRNFTET